MQRCESYLRVNCYAEHRIPVDRRVSAVETDLDKIILTNPSICTEVGEKIVLSQELRNTGI